MKKTAILLFGLLDFSADGGNIAFTAKPTYKLWVPYEIFAFYMYTLHLHLDNKAVEYFRRSSMLPTCRNHCIRRDNVPQRRAATKQPLPDGGLIGLLLGLGELSTRVWFGVVPHLAVFILPGTAFQNHFARGFFPSECKMFSWPSKPVAIVLQTGLSKSNNSLQFSPYRPDALADE